MEGTFAIFSADSHFKWSYNHY